MNGTTKKARGQVGRESRGRLFCGLALPCWLRELGHAPAA